MTGASPGAAGGRPLRLTHVVVTEAFAGTERYVCDVSVELARRGHDVTVVGGSPAAMGALLDGVRWLPGGGVRQAVRSLVGGGRRDIVHSHLTHADFAAFFATPRHRAARVATRHILAPRGYHPATRRLGRIVRRTMAAEIAVSRFVADSVESPIDAVILNGVADAPGPGATSTSRTVLVAQRLEDEKDLSTALRAWARSGLGTSGWRLHIAGDGPRRVELEAEAAALGIADHVDFLGFVDDIHRRFDEAAIFLAPAPQEPLGLSVMEAMAHGLPVIAAGAAGHLETLGQASGAALFPPGDADACAQRLVELAQAPEDRQQYGERLRELQRRRFSLPAHVDQLVALYEGVVAP